MSGNFIRITASLRDKSGSEIMAYETRQTDPRSDLRETLAELTERMIDRHGVTISEGKCSLIVRVEDAAAGEWIKRRDGR